MAIQELSTHMNHGEIRLHVDLDLLDESTEEVLQWLKGQGFSPVLGRYTWQSKEAPEQVLTSNFALLFHCTLPNSEIVFDAIYPQWELLEKRFSNAVTMVWAGGKMGHNIIPPTTRYQEAIAA
jgi:hypothetical protein